MLKYLLIFTILFSFANALSIEGKKDVTLTDEQLDEILREAEKDLDKVVADSLKLIEENKAKQKQEEKMKQEAAEEEAEAAEDDKSSSTEDDFWIVGFGFGGGGSNEVLMNSTGDVVTPRDISGVHFRVGMIFGATDIFLNLNSMKVDKELQENILNLHVRYRFFDGYSWQPYFGLLGGTASLKTEPEPLPGISFGGELGLKYLITNSFTAEIGYVKDYVFWDYPIVGIVSYFDQNAVNLAFEYRF